MSAVTFDPYIEYVPPVFRADARAEVIKEAFVQELRDIMTHHDQLVKMGGGVMKTIFGLGKRRAGGAITQRAIRRAAGEVAGDAAGAAAGRGVGAAAGEAAEQAAKAAPEAAEQAAKAAPEAAEQAAKAAPEAAEQAAKAAPDVAEQAAKASPQTADPTDVTGKKPGFWRGLWDRVLPSGSASIGSLGAGGLGFAVGGPVGGAIGLGAHQLLGRGGRALARAVGKGAPETIEELAKRNVDDVIKRSGGVVDDPAKIQAMEADELAKLRADPNVEQTLQANRMHNMRLRPGVGAAALGGGTLGGAYLLGSGLGGGGGGAPGAGGQDRGWLGNLALAVPSGIAAHQLAGMAGLPEWAQWASALGAGAAVPSLV